MSDNIKKTITIDTSTGDATDKLNELGNELDRIAESSIEASEGVDAVGNSSAELAGNIATTSDSMNILDKVTGGMASQFMNARSSIKAAGISLKGFRGALLAAGIGALVVLLGELVANWDKVRDAITGVTKEQRTLMDSIEETKTLIVDTIKNVNEVEQAFRDFNRGIISSDEALEIYNKTLGDTFGIYDDISEAEDEFIAKTNAYIKSVALRSQAEVLAQKEAEIQAQITLATHEDNTNLVDKLNRAYSRLFKGIDNGYQLQRDRTNEVIEGLTEEGELLRKNRERLLDQARAIEDEAGIDYESRKKAREARRQAEKEEAEAQRAREARRAEEEKQREIELQQRQEYYDEVDRILNEQLESQLTDQEKEENAVENKYFNLIEQAIKYGEDTTELEEARQAELLNIEEKYAELRRIALGKGEIGEIDQLTDEILQMDNDFEAIYAKIEEQREMILNAENITEQERNELLKRNSDLRIQIQEDEAQAVTEIEELKAQAISEAMNIVSDSLMSMSSILGEETEMGKLMAIASTTIAGIESATQAYKAMVGIPVVGPKLAVAAATSAGLAAAANIKQIKAVKVPGGRASGGGTQTPSFTRPPEFNIIGQSETNQLGQLLNEETNEPIRAYVVSGEVSTQQELDRSRIDNSIFL